jgi:pentatricopeptide repeat protein
VTKREVRQPKVPSKTDIRRRLRRRRHRKTKRLRTLASIREQERSQRLLRSSLVNARLLDKEQKSSVSTPKRKGPKKKGKRNQDKEQPQPQEPTSSTEQSRTTMTVRQLVNNMKALISSDNVDQAEALWTNWKQSQQKLKGAYSPYNLLIKAFAERGAVDRVRQLIEMMKNEGLTPSFYIQFSLLRAHLNINQIAEAMKLYEEIKNDLAAHRKSFNRKAYSQLLIALANKGDIDATEKVFKDMAFDRINPSRTVRVVMKKMYETKGRPDRTMELLHQYRRLVRQQPPK